MTMNLPYIVEPDSDANVTRWLDGNRQWLDCKLETIGAVLLRGFDVSTESHFQRVVTQFSKSPLTYLYRSTPRTDLGQGIYTATEYPAGLPIPQHNENAYQTDWPLRLMFFCMEPAESGGFTPLTSTVAVTDGIDPAIRARFKDKGVMYVRNYRNDIDLPWQTVFQTDSKEKVEAYCRSNNILFEWRSNDGLRTRQVCQAMAIHPHTRQEIWFNQAHLFHPSALDQRTQEGLRLTFEEEDFPRNALYGDGSPISESHLAAIRKAFNQEQVTFQWRKNDILILDNMLISHGRTPYKGRRRVLTAMCDPYSEAARHSLASRA